MTSSTSYSSTASSVESPTRSTRGTGGNTIVVVVGVVSAGGVVAGAVDGATVDVTTVVESAAAEMTELVPTTDLVPSVAVAASASGSEPEPHAPAAQAPATATKEVTRKFMLADTRPTATANHGPPRLDEGFDRERCGGVVSPTRSQAEPAWSSHAPRSASRSSGCSWGSACPAGSSVVKLARR